MQQEDFDAEEEFTTPTSTNAATTDTFDTDSSHVLDMFSSVASEIATFVHSPSTLDIIDIMPCGLVLGLLGAEATGSSQFNMEGSVSVVQWLTRLTTDMGVQETAEVMLEERGPMMCFSSTVS